MIPAEAVEAAARAIYQNQTSMDWESRSDVLKETVRGDARAALEAAAPYILAAAFKNAADQLEYGNPISGWLYDLADEYMLNSEGEK